MKDKIKKFLENVWKILLLTFSVVSGIMLFFIFNKSKGNPTIKPTIKILKVKNKTENKDLDKAVEKGKDTLKKVKYD